jgi:hypothetical protein
MNTLKTLLGICILSIAPSWAFAQNSTPQAFAGKVTAVSENSITVTHRGQPKTLSVDASTTITDAANISEIQVGQIVGVRTDFAGTKAVTIRAKWNPTSPVQPASTPAAPAE